MILLVSLKNKLQYKNKKIGEKSIDSHSNNK